MTSMMTKDRREYLKRQLANQEPEQLLKQVCIASKNPRRGFNQGVTHTMQWLLGIRADAPFEEDKPNDTSS